MPKDNNFTMKVNPTNKITINREQNKDLTQKVTKVIALIIAFVSTFFFFFKLLFF